MKYTQEAGIPEHPHETEKRQALMRWQADYHKARARELRIATRRRLDWAGIAIALIAVIGGLAMAGIAASLP